MGRETRWCTEIDGPGDRSVVGSQDSHACASEQGEHGAVWRAARCVHEPQIRKQAKEAALGREREQMTGARPLVGAIHVQVDGFGRDDDHMDAPSTITVYGADDIEPGSANHALPIHSSAAHPTASANGAVGVSPVDDSITVIVERVAQLRSRGVDVGVSVIAVAPTARCVAAGHVEEAVSVHVSLGTSDGHRIAVLVARQVAQLLEPREAQWVVVVAVVSPARDAVVSVAVAVRRHTVDRST